MNVLAQSVPFILALFEHSFLRYALLTGLIMGGITPLIGAFVVIRRLSFIADTLSHFSLAGLSIGLFLINTLGYTFISDPLYLAIIASIIGALIIEILRGYYENYKEISMPIVMSLGTALSALFISLSGGFNTSIYNFLFGSILTVGDKYLAVMSTTAILVLALVFFYYRKLVIISFDESHARLLGIKVGRFQFVSTLILALVVSLSIATVGVLLVSSLMIIPVAAAMKIGKSFKNTIFIAVLFSELSVIGGLWLSYDLNIASGATIVLVNIFILFVVVIIKHIYTNQLRSKRTTKEDVGNV
ncbi:MAG: metal ABC transporter permease [Candidatus Izimaplasma sp.]|nr:metal ABC transporter permease [Candidatus Izimaplasma bacterium]